MIRVFICMPYGDDYEPGHREANAREAMKVWHVLADAGFWPFCPHLSHYLHEMDPRPRLHWLSNALGWVEVSDCLLAIGEPTEGMKHEIARMNQLKRPVFRTLETLAEAYGMEIK